MGIRWKDGVMFSIRLAGAGALAFVIRDCFTHAGRPGFGLAISMSRA